MKYFTVIALILSVVLVQTVVAQNWKDSIAQEYNNKYARFLAARTKSLNRLATIKNNPQTSECVKQATAKLEAASPGVKTDIENCVNSANDPLVAQQCAKRVFKKFAIETLKPMKC